MNLCPFPVQADETIDDSLERRGAWWPDMKITYASNLMLDLAFEHGDHIHSGEWLFIRYQGILYLYGRDPVEKDPVESCCDRAVREAGFATDHHRWLLRQARVIIAETAPWNIDWFVECTELLDA